MRVRELEDLLFRAFPREAAEVWDRPGLSVGDPDAEAKGIACALDAMPETIRAAAQGGCNVLVTHHPAFLEPPFPVTPEPRSSSIGGACVWTAARLGVSLVAMHTNLDRSDAVLDLLASLVGLPRTGRLEEPDGYGALLDARGLTLGELASRCAAAFETTPVIWGAENEPLSSAAFCSGSLGSLGTVAIKRGVSCVIAGEAGYHRLSELNCAHVNAILLGHDASELPFAGLLARTIAEAVPELPIRVLDEALRWRAWAGRE